MQALAAAVLSLALPAMQTGPQDPPIRPRAPLTFATEARTVNLTVTVQNENGKFLRNLTAQDFAVFEDEQVQDIAYFARVFDPSRAKDEGRDGAADPTAIDLGILFDTSESMADVLRLSQDAAVQFLETIPRARELTTVFFDSDIRLSRYNSEAQQGLFDRIQKIKAPKASRTLLYDSMAMYLSRVGDEPGRKIMVLFTDGEDVQSQVNISELKDLFRSSTVTVYPILFKGAYMNVSSGLRSNALMRDIAEMTGGELFTPKTFKDLQPIYDGLLDELAAQYVIGYVPKNDPTPGDHRLRVEVAVPDAKIRHRRGFRIAPPPSDANKK